MMVQLLLSYKNGKLRRATRQFAQKAKLRSGTVAPKIGRKRRSLMLLLTR